MPVAVAALGGLLREAPARALFAKSGGVALLAPLLRAGAAGGPGAPSSQLLYEAGLAIWQLSFYQPAAAAMGSAGVLPGLVELARTAPKEKVRRCTCLDLQGTAERLQVSFWLPAEVGSAGVLPGLVELARSAATGDARLRMFSHRQGTGDKP